MQALERLRAALEQNTEASTEQRELAGELVADAIGALKADKPNPPKIYGPLGGLATTVRTVASLRGAWQTVKDASSVIGFPLP